MNEENRCGSVYQVNSSANHDIHYILRLIASGDHAAFTLVYQKYMPIIESYIAIWGCRDLHGKKDLLQEIFLGLWLKREKLSAVNSFENYLFIITKNRCLTYKMSVDRNKISYGLTKDDENLPGDQMYEGMNYTEAKNIYTKAVNLLPPQARKVHILKEDGLKTNQIAKILGISPMTVKNHRQLAIKKLKLWLNHSVN